jgi:hypothetical protein
VPSATLVAGCDISSVRSSIVPWGRVAGMRDRLLDDYFGGNLEVVWRSAFGDVPAATAAFRETSSQRTEPPRGPVSALEPLLGGCPRPA